MTRGNASTARGSVVNSTRSGSATGWCIIVKPMVLWKINVPISVLLSDALYSESDILPVGFVVRHHRPNRVTVIDPIKVTAEVNE